MEQVDWRAPGSVRTHAASSWSPMADKPASEETDPFRVGVVTAVPGDAVVRRGFPSLALRPGIVPMRPLGLGDVYGGVIRAVRGNVGSTMGLAAGTTTVFLVPLTALAVWVGGLTATYSDQVTPASFAVYIPSVGTWLSSILLAGFMAYVVGQGVLGRRVTAGETLSRTMRRIGALLLATFLIVGADVVVGGLAAFIVVTLGMSTGSGDSGDVALLLGVLVILPVVLVAVIVLQTYFSFTTPAIVLEHLSAPRAVARSWRLVGPPHRSGFWRILGIRLLTSVVAGMIGQLVATPMTAMAGLLLGVVAGESMGSIYLMGLTVLQGVVAMLTGILVTPFVAGVDAALYIDARIRREALDVQLLNAGQDAASVGGLAR